jgi:hypothetical protein
MFQMIMGTGGSAMTKRRLFWLAYAACLGVAVLWGVRLFTPRHRINRENIDKIQVGMSLEDVESLLGAPPGDYTRGNFLLLTQDHPRNIYWAASPLDLTWGDARWIGDDAAVAVWLDPQKGVTKTQFAEVICLDAEQGILDKIRSWLRLESNSKSPGLFYLNTVYVETPP